MRYWPLFSLQIFHAFYKDAVCADFRIVPSPDTARLLKNHRCILKDYMYGIQVFIPVEDGGDLFLPFDNAAVFHFQLFLNNPEFPLFTDLDEFNQLLSPCFSNLTPEGVRSNDLVLISRDETPPKGSAFTDAFLHYDPDWKTSDEGTPHFSITFQAKSMKWHYYLITDQTDGVFSIEDKDTTPLKFNGNKFSAENFAEKSSIAADLILSNPHAAFWIFESTTLVPFQNTPRKSLQLLRKLNNRFLTIMHHLPNASFINYTTALSIEEDSHEEVFVFQVIKYLSQPILTTGG